MSIILRKAEVEIIWAAATERSNIIARPALSSRSADDIHGRRISAMAILGYVFHMMEQVNELACLIEHRRVDGAPITFNEPPIGVSNVIALSCHRVRLAGFGGT